VKSSTQLSRSASSPGHSHAPDLSKVERQTGRSTGLDDATTLSATANGAGIFRHFAGLAEHLERPDIRSFPAGGAETVVRRDPVGVCALIAPWNFPISLVVIKLAQALLAGCTAVIKPAPSTPLSIRFVVEAAEAPGRTGGRRQPGDRRRRGRGAARPPPGRRQGRVHRFHRRGPPNRRGLRRAPSAGHSRARRQVLGDRIA
jgi:hypothetical protein